MRRKFLGMLGSGLAILASGAWPQQNKQIRVGFLSNRYEGVEQFLGAFREGLASYGYVEGRNLALDVRIGDTTGPELQRLADELAALRPLAIVAQGPAARFAVAASASVPIVFGFSGDPIEAGFTSSLGRPDKNMTGMTFLTLDLVGKRIQILKDLLPKLQRIAVFSYPVHAGERREFAASTESAQRLGLTVTYHPYHNASELDAGLAAALAARAEAGVVFPDGLMIRYRDVFARFSVEHRVPLISGWSIFADGGNLLSFGPNLIDAWRRVAYYVDRLAQGARTSDLPIEFPLTVETVLNLKTAKALRITIPQSIRLLSSRVIE